jgi:hypothetical protein
MLLIGCPLSHMEVLMRAYPNNYIPADFLMGNQSNIYPNVSCLLIIVINNGDVATIGNQLAPRPSYFY